MPEAQLTEPLDRAAEKGVRLFFVERLGQYS